VITVATMTTDNNIITNIEAQIVELLRAVFQYGPEADEHLRRWVSNSDLRDLVDLAASPPAITLDVVPLLLLDQEVGEVRDALGLSFERAEQVIQGLKPRVIAAWRDGTDVALVFSVDGRVVALPDIVAEARALVEAWQG
jgi:hypothetical protein